MGFLLYLVKPHLWTLVIFSKKLFANYMKNIIHIEIMMWNFAIFEIYMTL